MNAGIGCLIPDRVRTCGCSETGWFRGGEFLANTMVEQGAGYPSGNFSDTSSLKLLKTKG